MAPDNARDLVGYTQEKGAVILGKVFFVTVSPSHMQSPYILFQRRIKEALNKSARADGKRFAAQGSTIYSELP